MSSRTPHRRTAGERGAALVEFALVLPFLAILVFGTVDIGRAYMAWNQVKGAAREGASYAQYNPSRVEGGSCTAPDTIDHRARGEHNGPALTVITTREGSATPLTCGAAVTPGDTVRVRVSREFTLVTPIAGALIGDPAIVSASVEVVVQG